MSGKPSDGLGGMPTGPELAMRLALIDPHDVPDDQLLELLAAQWRQLAYRQAQTWVTMAEIGRRDPMPDLPGGRRWSAAEVFENAVDEIRAELVLTRRFAGDELAHASEVAALPRVMAALAEGSIDRVRAIKFAEGCLDLTDQQTDVLLDELLPTASGVTATGLAERIARVATALDPAWAERRYTEAIRDRKVIGYLNPDGSATVSGQNLPAEDAAAACARVDALADLAKRAGAKAKIDHLRAELFLGLLDGRLHGLPEPAIIAELLRMFPKQPAEHGEQAAPQPAGQPVPAGEPQPAGHSAADAPGSRGSHLRVGLGTLLGLDDESGEIAGMGMIRASVARIIATRQRASEWRYAILDENGRPLFDGITGRRPRTTDRRVRQVRGGIVELHVPLDLLTDPDLARAHPDWEGVLADLSAQYTKQRPIEQDPNARFAGRPLRRRQQTRFQRCLFRGCRRPATDCDLDHRHDHARGGTTTEDNTAPGCRHDHQLKTAGGWRLIRRDATTYLWISPLGRKHVVTIDPIAVPLPKPIPRLLPPARAFPRAVESGSDPPPF